MSFVNKEFSSIDEKDLQSLVDNGVIEKKTIEYKEVTPGNSEAEKKEFLADVSSFANSAGGDIIYGMREVDGVPTELSGLTIANIDAEKLRFENIIRTGVDPRIPGVSIREIPLQSSKVVMIIRIPRSWALPHMVIFRGHSRFYSRNSAGKYPLDVSEIRALFTLSETTLECIRNFRLERLSKVISEETPVALDDVPKIILHIIPFSAFDPMVKFDVNSLSKSMGLLGPIYASSWGHRHNFDGLLTYSKFLKSTSAYSYLQIFRNGAIEAVEAFLLRPNGEERVIASVAYERELLEALPRYLAIQKQLGVEPPLFIMLSLLGVVGYTMAVDRSRFMSFSGSPIDRDTLLIPEVIIENIESNLAEVMRPIFDAIWNSAGWPRSMNYNEKGEWVGH